jgi:hypothetical protein
MLTQTTNGAQPTPGQHRVDKRSLARAPIDNDATLSDDADALIPALSTLIVAIVRQARLDLRHECGSACWIQEFKHRSTRTGKVLVRHRRRDCRADRSGARHFLRLLGQGLVPDWMHGIILAARVRVKTMPGEPFEPRVEHAPRHNHLSTSHV